METSDCLFFWLFLTFTVVSSQSINTQPSIQYKHSGEKITLECDITGAVIGTGFTWAKRQESAQSGIYTTVINTATSAPGFHRYSAAVTEGGSKYRLTINTLAEEDSGYYRCEIHSPSGGVAAFVEHSLSVLTNIDSVFIDGTADSTQYNRSSSSKTTLNYVVGSGNGYFVCEVSGGYPRPEVTVMVEGDGGRNVTASLVNEESIQYEGNTVGLQKIKYIQRYTSNSFDLPATDDGHTIVCKAQVLDQDTTVAYSAEESAVLNLLYRPEVILKRNYTADIGDTNVQIAVEVKANPNISSANWTAMSSGEVVANGETKDGMTATLQAKHGAYAFILVIDRVKLENFQVYEARLGNEYGSMSDTVSLFQGPRGVSTARAFNTIGVSVKEESSTIGETEEFNTVGVTATERFSTTTPTNRGRKLSIFPTFIVIQISAGLFAQLGC